jgi:hypothetical protein
MGELYALTFPNGKQYLGITNQTAEARYARHWKKTTAGQNNAVNHALRKYGRAAVTVKTLVVADDWDYLCELERRAIAAFGTFAPGGYNTTHGGEGVLGLVCKPETRAKLSAINTGKKYTPEQCARLSEILRKRPPPSPETRAKLSAALMGKTHSEESKRKCGVANIGKKMTPAMKAKQRLTVYAKGGGVCFDSTRGKWMAYVKLNRKTTILGRFDTEAAAREARNKKQAEMEILARSLSSV